MILKPVINDTQKKKWYQIQYWPLNICELMSRALTLISLKFEERKKVWKYDDAPIFLRFFVFCEFGSYEISVGVCFRCWFWQLNIFEWQQPKTNSATSHWNIFCSNYGESHKFLNISGGKFCLESWATIEANAQISKLVSNSFCGNFLDTCC